MSDIFDIFWSLFAFSLVSLLSPLFEVSSKIQTRRKRYSLYKKKETKRRHGARFFLTRETTRRERESARARERERERVFVFSARALLYINKFDKEEEGTPYAFFYFPETSRECV